MIADMMEIELREKCKELTSEDVFNIMYSLTVKMEPEIIKSYTGAKENFANNLAVAFMMSMIERNAKKESK